MNRSKSRPAAVPTIQIKNDRIIVTRWRFAPGAETGWHRHAHDYIVVPLDSGKLLAESDEGPTTLDLATGVSYSRNAGVEHNVININDSEFEFIEIEILNQK
ncbi:MAG: cupin domain-containing protein [Gammaproteobacteria bacterium]|nr:cupin domain-containing protein [Gammaproteobacteria bacterium]